jgi:hypothetical protein
MPTKTTVFMKTGIKVLVGGTFHVIISQIVLRYVLFMDGCPKRFAGQSYSLGVNDAADYEVKHVQSRFIQ